MKALSARLASGQPLILDGAMGTQLLTKGVDVELPLWSASVLESSPGRVEEIHRDYVASGAEVLTANTFRTTTRTFLKVSDDKVASRRARNTCKAAVEAARRAAGGDCYVAGAMAPLEDCYLPKLFPGEKAALEEFSELGNWLVEDGADILLIETMGHMDETRFALRSVAKHSIDKWVSFILQDSCLILDGSDLREASTMAVDEGASAVLINCSRLTTAVEAMEVLMEVTTLPVGLYPNLGRSMPSPDGTIESFFTTKEFRKAMAVAMSKGARIVGSCCGSGPEHTSALRKLVRERNGSFL